MGLYNFEYLEDCIDDIRKTDHPSYAMLNELKKQLNMAFPDCKCTQVIYTENTDKLFFGACVYPEITDHQVKTIIQSDEPVRVTNYILELDSKLLSPILNLSTKELTAILMHEIGHMTNTANPVEEVRKALDIYMIRNNDHIKLSDSSNYVYILKFGIQDTLIKVSSVFYMKDEEFKADSFAIKTGYGPALEEAMDKIYRKGFIINKDVNDKFIVLAWVLRLYKDVKMRRIPALRTINRSKSLSPCKTEITALDALAMRLKRIDDSSLIECAIISEGVLTKNMFDMKMKGIIGFENDLYEYRMLIANIDEQDEAILVMRQLNARIAILEDMMRNPNATDTQRIKIDKLLDGFKEVREKLAKKVTYKERYVGIVVNYPAIKGLDY